MKNNLTLDWFNKLKKHKIPEISNIAKLVPCPSFVIPKWTNIDDAVIFIVINQMLSIKASETICSNLFSEFNDSKNILKFCCDTYNIKGALMGLSQRKRITLKNWYDFKMSSNINFSKKRNQLLFLDELKKQKGFGQWSIDMLSIFYFGMSNIWPLNDMNILKVSKIIFGTSDKDIIKSKIVNHETIIALCFWEIIDRNIF